MFDFRKYLLSSHLQSLFDNIPGFIYPVGLRNQTARFFKSLCLQIFKALWNCSKDVVKSANLIFYCAIFSCDSMLWIGAMVSYLETYLSTTRGFINDVSEIRIVLLPTIFIRNPCRTLKCSVGASVFNSFIILVCN